MVTKRKRSCQEGGNRSIEVDADSQPPLQKRRRTVGPSNRSFAPRVQAIGRFFRASVGFIFHGRSLVEGTYYDTISGLWETQVEDAFVVMAVVDRSLKRTDPDNHKNLANCRHFDKETRERSTIDPYDKTYKGVANTRMGPKAMPSRTSHNSATMKTAIWPTNIMGPDRIGEIAHLVPVSPANADSWWFVVPWLFGWKSGQWTWRQLKKAIHGSATSNGNRIPHTGIKHMVANKARIFGQGICFDGSPCLLVIPILSPEKARDWNGEGYDAIMLIDQWEDCTLREVASTTSFALPCEHVADRTEIDTARQLLAFFLRAILTAIKHAPPTVPDDYYEGDGSLYNGDGIVVPSRTLPTFPIVRKVRFVDQSWDGDPNKHPAPDPILLASRAAVVFSARQNQRLAASAEPQEDDDEHWTELDRLAAEEYLEWREGGLRSQMEADLQ